MISHFPSDIPSYFADAEASFKESNIVLFGVPYDKTASFRPGSRFGPDEIRKASWNFEPYNILTGKSIQDCLIHDYGNVNIKEQDKPKKVFEKITHFAQDIRKSNKIPVMIGGEHTETAASIQAFGENIHSIIFDAHLDFRDTYVHERYNHACTIRRVNDHIPGDQIYVLGVRSAEKKEYDEAMKENVHIFTSDTTQQQGIKSILSKMKQNIQNKPVYLSIDIDALDPCYAPGTGTLEPFGLNPLDIIDTITSFSSQIRGADIMEVAPSYDHGETAVLAAKIIRLLLEHICFQYNEG